MCRMYVDLKFGDVYACIAHTLCGNLNLRCRNQWHDKSKYTQQKHRAIFIYVTAKISANFQKEINRIKNDHVAAAYLLKNK